jgi:hypothetical protein
LAYVRDTILIFLRDKITMSRTAKRLLACCLAAFPVGAAADPTTIAYTAPAAWILPPPSTVPDAAPEGTLLKFAFVDGQVRVTPAGVESFSSYRMTILQPEALAAGNITLTWNPAAGEARVHALRIIRAGVPIDVLATTRFRVIQRERPMPIANYRPIGETIPAD